MFLKLEHNIDKETFVKMSDRLNFMRNQIRNLSHSLAKPYLDSNSDNLVDLIKALLIDYTYLFPTVSFDFNHFPEFIAKNDYDSSQLLIIIKELINNAINHSSSDEIDINITEHEKNIILIIEDNGIGFETSKINNGLGLTNISTRVKQLGGSFKIESFKNNGSSFIIELNKPQKPSNDGNLLRNT